jgi:ABC-type antimicrobial peptide transport system permease subunit
MKRKWIAALAALTMALPFPMSISASAVNEDIPAQTDESMMGQEESSNTDAAQESADQILGEILDSNTATGNADGNSDSSQIDYENDPYYDTEGNASLIENQKIIYDSDEMQFISVTTKNGNVFYILIDYTAAKENGGENVVYFLNKVDDYDLYTLLNDGNNSDNSVEDYEKQNGTAFGKTTSSIDESKNAVETTTSTAAASSSSKSGNKNMMIILCVVVVIGAGAAIFFFKFKKKKSTVPNDELDFDEYDEDEDGDE